MRYIEGEARYQKTFFPESIDDYITAENPVRFIDAFIDKINLRDLGFAHLETKETGRKPYNPGDILELYVYGYLNKVRESRLLEKLTHQNIEVIWLLRKLKPDFKTIADFRKDNGKAIKQVLKEFNLLCRKLGVLDSEIVAVDGSKFRAQNSAERNYSKNQVQEMLAKTEEKVAEYLEQLNSNDISEPEEKRLSVEELHSKIKMLKDQSNQYQEYLDEMVRSGAKQISTSYPDSRKMQTRNGKQISYNVQIAVDAKSKLIIANDVTNEGNDLNQLHNMALQAKEYIAEKVVGKTSLADCLHIALATINRADFLVSWNSKHIVNMEKIKEYNSINIKKGYKQLEIRSRREFEKYEDD